MGPIRRKLRVPRSRKLVEHIRRMCTELGRDGVILGLSGGLDSAVVAALAVRAVGKERVTALLMPERDASPRHLRDASRLASELGIRTRTVSISPFLRKAGARFPVPFLPRPLKAWLTRLFLERQRAQTGSTPFLQQGSSSRRIRQGTAYYRIKHRLRMSLLYYHAERENLLVLGCANRTEYMTGFFVKHGIDHCADAMPLVNLYKTQVRKLAEELQIPGYIREKAPSPDIVPGVSDEYALGIDYTSLDLVLAGLETGYAHSTIRKTSGVDDATISYVKRLIEESRHMRTMHAP